MLKTIAYLTLTGLALVQGRGLESGGLRGGSKKWNLTGRGRGNMDAFDVQHNWHPLPAGLDPYHGLRLNLKNYRHPHPYHPHRDFTAPTVTGKCTGNTGGTGDVDCSGETTNTANKGASVTGTDVSTCCEAPVDMCKCTGNGNEIECSITGKRHCSSNLECTGNVPLKFGDWGMCTLVDRCKCTGNGNEIECSVTGKRHCSSNQDCTGTVPRAFGDWGMCTKKVPMCTTFFKGIIKNKYVEKYIKKPCSQLSSDVISGDNAKSCDQMNFNKLPPDLRQACIKALRKKEIWVKKGGNDGIWTKKKYFDVYYKHLK